MRSCNSERSALFGENYSLCNDRTGKKESGGGGFVWFGEGTVWASRSAFCLPEGAKKEQSKDKKSLPAL